MNKIIFWSGFAFSLIFTFNSRSYESQKICPLEMRITHQLKGERIIENSGVSLRKYLEALDVIIDNFETREDTSNIKMGYYGNYKGVTRGILLEAYPRTEPDPSVKGRDKIHWIEDRSLENLRSKIEERFPFVKVQICPPVPERPSASGGNGVKRYRY